MKHIITLSNGKKVANFSSPHEFIFTDGSYLKRVPMEISDKLKVTFIEKDLGDGDISLRFDLSADLLAEVSEYMILWVKGEVDVVFCPLPMITAMKESKKIPFTVKNSPFRSIRIENRLLKHVSIDKQCI